MVRPLSLLNLVDCCPAGVRQRSRRNGVSDPDYAFGATDTSPGTSLERTIIHEIGHQYFYGLVASNEFEEAWLDESFTSYAEDRLMEQEYGVVSSLPLQSSLVSSSQPLKLETWKYTGDDAYTRNVYIRGKLVLKDIERIAGTKNMDAILAAYARKYRFQHPSTADFQKVVEKVTKQSWQTYFERYVYSGVHPTSQLMISGSRSNRTTAMAGQPL